MSQIMRLRRRAGSDHHIKDRNNGYNHEHAFVNNIRKNGLLHENDLLADSFGGKFNPKSAAFLMYSLPVITKAILRRKATPAVALLHPHRKEYKGLRDYFDEIEGRDDRLELNLYIVGYDEEDTGADAGETSSSTGAQGGEGMASAPGPQAERAPEEALEPEPAEQVHAVTEPGGPVEEPVAAAEPETVTEEEEPVEETEPAGEPEAPVAPPAPAESPAADDDEGDDEKPTTEGSPEA
jgi:hypothetical protein